MLRTRPTILVCLLLALAAESPTLAAQSPASTESALALTLGDAVALALTRSAELERAGYSVDLQDLEVASARAADDLQLSLSAGSSFSYARGYRTDFFGNPDATSAGFQIPTDGRQSRGLTTSAQVTLPVFDGGARAANRRAAEHALDAGRHDEERTADNVANQAATQYLRALQAEELVRVEEASLEAGRVLLERVEAEFDAGNRNLVDVLQQRAAIATGEQRLANVRRNRGVTRLELRQLLRLPPGTELELAAVPDDLPGLPSTNEDIAALVEQALGARPDLAAQASAIEAARQDIGFARAGRFPTLSITGSVGSSFNSLDDNRPFGGQFLDVNPRASLGLSISLPVLDGGRTGRATERARLFLRDADAVLGIQERNVSAAVETAVLDAEAADAVLNAATEAVSAAREAFAASEARYGAGSGIFLDVLDARRTLVQSEADVVSAQYDLLISRILLAYHTGSLRDVLVAFD